MRQNGWSIPCLALLLLLLAACGAKESPTPSSSVPAAEMPGGATTTAASVSSDIEALVGEYRVTGRNLDGSARLGTLEITANGELLELRWQVGAGEAGSALRAGSVLAAGWGGEQCAVALYRLGPGGDLMGRWQILGGEEVGTEEATRLAGERGSAAGSYEVFGNSPNGTTYTGTLTLEEQGEVYQLDWLIDGEFEFTGIGILRDDVLAVGWGGDGCGVSVYTIGLGGELTGVWGQLGETRLGTEQATQQ